MLKLIAGRLVVVVLTLVALLFVLQYFTPVNRGR